MSWSNVVQTVGKWYEANIHDYNQGGYSKCSIANTGNVRHDCSGYVSACLRAAGIISPTTMYRSGDFLANGSAASALKRAGFVPMRYSLANCKPYDIIAYNGHVEIYAGKMNGSDRSWSWGSCHDGRNGRVGMPAYMAAKTRYVTMWRQGGNAAAIADPYIDPNNASADGFSTGDVTNNYETYSSNIDSAIFASALNNSFTPTTTQVVSADSSDGHRTRIYSASNPTISVDELSMPMNEGSLSTESEETNN